MYKISHGNPTGEEITCWGTYACVCVCVCVWKDLTEIGEDMKWIKIRYSAWSCQVYHLIK